jgi:hypothetical protein
MVGANMGPQPLDGLSIDFGASAQNQAESLSHESNVEIGLGSHVVRFFSCSLLKRCLNVNAVLQSGRFINVVAAC